MVMPTFVLVMESFQIRTGGGYALSNLSLYAWIGTLDPITRRLVVMASYGSGAVEPGLWLDPASSAKMQGMGSASTAIREDRQVWIQDIPNARPAVAFPLHRHAEVVGVFVLISGDEGSFDLDAQALLSEMASDMDFALGYFEHEAQRKRERRQGSGATRVRGRNDGSVLHGGSPQWGARPDTQPASEWG